MKPLAFLGTSDVGRVNTLTWAEGDVREKSRIAAERSESPNREDRLKVLYLGVVRKVNVENEHWESQERAQEEEDDHLLHGLEVQIYTDACFFHELRLSRLFPPAKPACFRLADREGLLVTIFCSQCFEHIIFLLSEHTTVKLVHHLLITESAGLARDIRRIFLPLSFIFTLFDDVLILSRQKLCRAASISCHDPPEVILELHNKVTTSIVDEF